MPDKNGCYIEIECSGADEFWDYLSPRNNLKNNISNFIYRGQRKSCQELMPTILREGAHNPATLLWKRNEIGWDDQVFAERHILEIFVNYCDLLGLKIINDSIDLRENHISTQSKSNLYVTPMAWPDAAMFEVMALAQHHGVPTRLLDWSRRSFVAAYFSASGAIRKKRKWKAGDRLAVWKLDIGRIGLYKNIEILKVPGSASSNLASQAGVFTLHRQGGYRGEMFKPAPMESAFSHLFADTPLSKITLPVQESKAVLELCEMYGVTGATLFPGFDGAATSVLDSINMW